MIIFTSYWIFIILLIIILTTVIAEQSHVCNRRCVTGSLHMKCRYNFVVTQIYNVNIDCDNDDENNCNDESYINSAFLINNKTPGPTIEVCLGDSIEIILHNKLSSHEISIHWNGIRQLGTPHMDGVTMISQCPILPFNSFQYDIKPDRNGTYFYHAHTIGQQGDGLYGGLIVRDIDNDLSMEKLFIMSSKSSMTLSKLSNIQSPSPISLTLNGMMNNIEFNVKSDSQYLLRLINANVFNCPIIFSIVNHKLRVNAIGDNLVELTKSANNIIIYPGERIDALLNTNQQLGKYHLILRGLNDCKNLIHRSILIYDGVKSSDIIQDNNDNYIDITEKLSSNYCDNLMESDILFSMNMKSQMKLNNIENTSITYYIPFDVNYYGQISDDMTEYSFKIYGFTYYPSYLTINSTNGSIAQINKMTFKYPPSPILSQPDAVPDDMICSLDDRAKICDNNPKFCECLQILPINSWTNVEIILIDEGEGGNVSQVFHVHGYSVSVIGFNHFHRSITKDEIISMDNQGLLPRNNINPPRMDTFIVPNKGYIIIRFHTNNVGYWLWESRSTSVLSSNNVPAMQFIMRVGNIENLPIVPINFPTCGNHKGPDLIFEDE